MEIMSMDKALQIARSYDKNRDGKVVYKEWYRSDDLQMSHDAKHWLDENADGDVTVAELAKGLQTGDVSIERSWASMTHPIGQLPAVAESVKMNLQLKAQVKSK